MQRLFALLNPALSACCKYTTKPPDSVHASSDECIVRMTIYMLYFYYFRLSTSDEMPPSSGAGPSWQGQREPLE